MQESRTERVTLTVTPLEKKAVKTVAAARDTDESSLMRTTLLPDIMLEYDRIRAVVAEPVG